MTGCAQTETGHPAEISPPPIPAQAREHGGKETEGGMLELGVGEEFCAKLSARFDVAAEHTNSL